MSDYWVISLQSKVCIFQLILGVFWLIEIVKAYNNVKIMEPEGPPGWSIPKGSPWAVVIKIPEGRISRDHHDPDPIYSTIYKSQYWFFKG